MPIYLAIPNDTLFFRGGEPMGMGESHFQTSIFPPSPETFIGAIRTLVIARKSNGDFEGYKNGRYSDKDWYKEVGFGELPESFNFIGPFLKKDTDILLTPPSNLFATSDKKKFAIAVPKHLNEVKHSSRLKHIMWIDKHNDIDSSDWKPVEDYITVKGMEKYLKGSIASLNRDDFTQLGDIFENEKRTGIALNKGLRTAKERHLYITSHKRFKENAVMVFCLDGVSSFPDSDILPLGGENRTVIYEKTSDLIFPSFEAGIEFLVTTTPFKVNKVVAGMPITDFLDDDLNVSLPGGIKSKLISYSVKRPLLFGGWDMAKNKSKDMVQYLPAGSVFYFEKCNVKGKNNKFLLGGENVQ
ncbi:MAG: type III-B CRISPR module-associated protein Cmr3 [Nitrospirae bacterium RIFCSPLOW2_12_42_9]|nr:MAG: type III-B CRISPR module-associated protein Cmr3 [Nitrospirae bacterium RIFCSPHIGHO2_02_FULL_42_12]OGW59675.1 MAG: type III-B CRISPR module-associated protein Cmr3 [Nitrospirae bacterium RIFCSPLOW2_12_42_9]